MKLQILEGTGITSCLSVRLHHIIKFYKENGFLPDEIDSSKQFQIYKDYADQIVYPAIIKEFVNTNKNFKIETNAINYNHGWNVSWYNEINIEELNNIVNYTTPLTEYVISRANEYKSLVEGRTAVLYRGNDKVLDIKRTPYEDMIEMAHDSNSTKFFVQTDEQDFLDEFKKHFNDVVTIDSIPRINKNLNRYILPEAGKRIEFIINYLAATLLLAQSPKLITVTGNVGVWTMIFRGHSNNVWQQRGDLGIWKKL